MTTFSRLQQVKRRFFAMRNGVIADTYRRAGSPFRIIFGLILPQIVEIADEFGPDAELAAALWANTSTRESMLLAPMLLNPDDITADDAMKMINECPSAETVDILCHRLLRHTPFAFNLAVRAAGATDAPLTRYAALRLLWHQLLSHPEECRKIAVDELMRNDPVTSQPARQIIDELNFIAGE